MPPVPAPSVTASRITADLAIEMIALFEGRAGDEARARAALSRDNGNLVNYCRWREAERLIRFMADCGSGTTVH